MLLDGLSTVEWGTTEHTSVLKNSPVAACDPQIGPKTVRIGSLRPLYAPKNALELSFSTA